MLAGALALLAGCGGGSYSPIDPSAYAARVGVTVGGSVDRAGLVAFEAGVGRVASGIGAEAKLRVTTLDGQKSAEVKADDSYELAGVPPGKNRILRIEDHTGGTATTVGYVKTDIPEDVNARVSANVNGKSTLEGFVAVQLATELAGGGSAKPEDISKALNNLSSAEIALQVEKAAPATGTISELAGTGGRITPAIAQQVQTQAGQGAERERMRKALRDMAVALQSAVGEDALAELLCDADDCEEDYTFAVKGQSRDKAGRRAEWKAFKETYEVIEFAQQLDLPDDLPTGAKRLTVPSGQRLLKVRRRADRKELVCTQQVSVTLRYGNKKNLWRIVKEEATDEMKCETLTGPLPVVVGPPPETSESVTAPLTATPGVAIAADFAFSVPVTALSLASAVSVTPAGTSYRAVLWADGFGATVTVLSAPRGAEGTITLRGLQTKEGGAQQGEIIKPWRLAWADPATLALSVGPSGVAADEVVIREGELIAASLSDTVGGVSAALPAAAPVQWQATGGATATTGGFTAGDSGPVSLTATLEGVTLSASVEVYEPQIGTPPTGGAGTLKGTISSAGFQPAGLAGVLVQIPALGLGTATNTSGRYAFTGLPSGTHTVIAVRDDVVQQSQTVVIP